MSGACLLTRAREQFKKNKTYGFESVVGGKDWAVMARKTSINSNIDYNTAAMLTRMTADGKVPTSFNKTPLVFAGRHKSTF